jgi:hypothetical protein
LILSAISGIYCRSWHLFHEVRESTLAPAIVLSLIQDVFGELEWGREKRF